MSDGFDGGGEHMGCGGARLSNGERSTHRACACRSETIPAGPETEPGPPPSCAGDPLDDFGDFVGVVRARLETGRREYGDHSFSAEPAELVRELREELADICGWGYVLDYRLRRVATMLRRLG